MKEKVLVVFALTALAVIVIACSAPPTPTPIASPTVPVPTAVPTKPAPTATPIPPTPTPVPLTVDMLKNAEYVVEGTASGKAKLANGKYEEPAAPGSAAKVTVQLADENITLGDLNNDGVQDAAVVLVWSGGGSGTFYNLYGVINDKSGPKPTAPEALGDRIKMKSVAIQAGEIAANFLTRKPGQAMAVVPTVDTTRKFKIQDGKLASTTPVTPTPTAVPTKAGGAVPKPAATATVVKPPAPKGSIAYHKSESGLDRMYVLTLDTNITTPLVEVGPAMDLALNGGGTNAHIAEWSPDNSRLAYIFTGAPGNANILRVVDFRITDPSSNTRSLDSEFGLSSPTWSPDGKQIGYVRLTATGVWSVETVNADGTGGRSALQKTQTEQYRGGLSWSKQGTFALAFNTTGKNSVYTMFNSPNSAKTQLTKNENSDDSTPAWSPDGKLIAFTSTRDGRPQIYVMNADGSGVRRVGQSTFADFSPTWSPDGKWIAFASTRGGVTDVYMMDINGGNVTQLTKSGGDHPVWSH